MSLEQEMDSVKSLEADKESLERQVKTLNSTLESEKHMTVKLSSSFNECKFKFSYFYPGDVQGHWFWISVYSYRVLLIFFSVVLVFSVWYCKHQDSFGLSLILLGLHSVSRRVYGMFHDWKLLASSKRQLNELKASVSSETRLQRLRQRLKFCDRTRGFKKGELKWRRRSVCDQFHLAFLNIAPDGNCLFSAFSTFLVGDGSLHAELRQLFWVYLVRL